MFSVPSNVGSDFGNATIQKPLIVRSIDKEKGLPKETQMAQCTITSGDIKASAQATFSKKLEGFCSTSEFCYFILLSLYPKCFICRRHGGSQRNVGHIGVKTSQRVVRSEVYD